MLTKTYSISCDHDGCDTPPVEISTKERPVDGPGRVRHEAFEAGWRRQSFGKDYCPVHAPEHSTASAPAPRAAGYRGVPMSLGTNGPVRVQVEPETDTVAVKTAALETAMARARAAQREAGT